MLLVAAAVALPMEGQGGNPTLTPASTMHSDARTRAEQLINEGKEMFKGAVKAAGGLNGGATDMSKALMGIFSLGSSELTVAPSLETTVMRPGSIKPTSGRGVAPPATPHQEHPVHEQQQQLQQQQLGLQRQQQELQWQQHQQQEEQQQLLQQQQLGLQRQQQELQWQQRQQQEDQQREDQQQQLGLQRQQQELQWLQQQQQQQQQQEEEQRQRPQRLQRHEDEYEHERQHGQQPLPLPQQQQQQQQQQQLLPQEQQQQQQQELLPWQQVIDAARRGGVAEATVADAEASLVREDEDQQQQQQQQPLPPPQQQQQQQELLPWATIVAGGRRADRREQQEQQEQPQRFDPLPVTHNVSQRQSSTVDNEQQQSSPLKTLTRAEPSQQQQQQQQQIVAEPCQNDAECLRRRYNAKVVTSSDTSPDASARDVLATSKTAADSRMAEEAPAGSAKAKPEAEVVDHELLRRSLEKHRPPKDMKWLDIALISVGGTLSFVLVMIGCFFGCRSTCQKEMAACDKVDAGRQVTANMVPPGGFTC